MKVRKVINFIIELISSPFILLFRTANVIPNPNKIVKPLIMLAISLLIVAGFILYVYREVIFK